MLLKDCPVGSVVRLVSVDGKLLPLSFAPYWNGEFEVKNSDDGVYVVDLDGDNRHEVADDPNYQFEIVRPAPEAAPEPRITFTVGGQEFYVGERVWSTEDAQDKNTKVVTHEELEVCGIGYENTRVFARKVGSPYMLSFTPKILSTTPPSPHEWKRGDWARHNEFGECFVCSGVDFAGEVRVDFVGCSASVRYETLTFIKHIDLPS